MKWNDLLDKISDWHTFIGPSVCSGLSHWVDSARRMEEYHFASAYLRRQPELANELLTRLYNLYFTDYDIKCAHPYNCCIRFMCLLFMENVVCGFQIVAPICFADKPICDWIKRLPSVLLEESMKNSKVLKDDL